MSFFSLLLGVLMAVAAPRSRTTLTSEVADQIFRARLPAGFHFNEKAPNTLRLGEQTLKPSRLDRQVVEFSPLPKSGAHGQASLYVCDDALTFCEIHRVDLKGMDKIQTKVEKPIQGRLNSHGFIENDYVQALAQARAKKALVLIDFSARWCPGCARLETEIFPRPEFKKLTRAFIKVKIDTDRFENSLLSEKFKVLLIPTLLVINADEAEVDRLVDFQALDVTERFFSQIQSTPLALAELTERAKVDAEMAYILGRRLLAAGQPRESLTYLNTLKPAPPELARARIATASADAQKDPSKKSEVVTALRSAIDSEPGSLRSLEWRLSLLTSVTSDQEKKAIAKAALQLADELLADATKLKEAIKFEPSGEATGYEAFYVASTRADLLEESGASAEDLENAHLKTVAMGRAQKIGAKNLGVAMRYLAALVDAEEASEADQLSRAMIKNNPGNPELQRQRLKVLVLQKKYNQAIQLGQSVIKNSYGRNEFYAAVSLARAYIAANQQETARTFIKSYLDRPDIQWPNTRGLKHLLEELYAQADTAGLKK